MLRGFICAFALGGARRCCSANDCRAVGRVSNSQVRSIAGWAMQKRYYMPPPELGEAGVAGVAGTAGVVDDPPASGADMLSSDPELPVEPE